MLLFLSIAVVQSSMPFKALNSLFQSLPCHGRVPADDGTIHGKSSPRILLFANYYTLHGSKFMSNSQNTLYCDNSMVVFVLVLSARPHNNNDNR